LILADPRWSRTQPLGLNCIILPRRKDIHTLRDINASHLPLLKHIQATVGRVLFEKFKIWGSRLAIFAEYLPRANRFYLRVTQFENRHYSAFSEEIPDDLSPHHEGNPPQNTSPLSRTLTFFMNLFIERSQHLLEDIIENVEIANDYYQRKTLLYQVERFDEVNLRLCEYRWFDRRQEGRLGSCDFHCQ